MKLPKKVCQVGWVFVCTFNEETPMGYQGCPSTTGAVRGSALPVRDCGRGHSSARLHDRNQHQECRN